MVIFSVIYFQNFPKDFFLEKQDDVFKDNLGYFTMHILHINSCILLNISYHHTCHKQYPLLF